MKARTLTISRRRWLRGERPGAVLYRSGDRKLCPLGFAARQFCGATIDEIRDVDDPVRIPEVFRRVLPWVVGDEYEVVELMAYNDSDFYTDEQREVYIAEIFKRHGIEVRFVP